MCIFAAWRKERTSQFSVCLFAVHACVLSIYLMKENQHPCVGKPIQLAQGAFLVSFFYLKKENLIFDERCA